MAVTTNLQLPIIGAGSIGKETLHNDGLAILDDAVAGYLSKSIAGSSNVTLTAAEARNMVIELTGLLTGNVIVFVPQREKVYIVFNNTTGAFSVTVQPVTSGTGIAVTQGSKALLYCNAINVVAGPGGTGVGLTDGDKGDITVSASGATWTIDPDVVTYAKLQNVSATSRVLGRITGGAGDTEELTGTQATTLLDNLVGDSGAGGTKGLVPAPAAGDAAALKFLKADATWAVPAAALSGGAANKLAYWTSASALSNDTDLHWDATGNNLGIGVATFGTTLHNGLALAHDGSNFPSTNVTDTFQAYARDQLGSTNASLFVKAEGGGITSVGACVVVGNGGVLLANPVATGGLQLDGVGPHLQLSNVAAIAHGTTGGGVATSTFFDIRPIVAGDGGVQMRGFTETNIATIISSVVVTDPVSTKTTTSDAALRFEFGKKVVATPEAMAAGVNLAVFSDVFAGGLGSRWILDNDGDTWQTGTATFLRSLEANTAGSGAPNVLDGPTETLKVLTNEGAAARNYHTLPSAVAGYQFTFVSQDADLMRVTANTGDTIRVAGGVTAAAGFIENGAIGDVITLVAINATEWIDLASRGTWTPT